MANPIENFEKRGSFWDETVEAFKSIGFTRLRVFDDPDSFETEIQFQDEYFKSLSFENIIDARAWLECFRPQALEKNISQKASVVLSARLGINFAVTPNELSVFQGDDYNAQQELLLKILASDRCQIGGDTYFPEPWNEGILKEDLNFDLPDCPLHRREAAQELSTVDEQINAAEAEKNDKGRTYGLSREITER